MVCLVVKWPSDMPSLRLPRQSGCSSRTGHPPLRPTILHLARVFASSSIKFRACLSKAQTPDKSRRSPSEKSNNVK